MSDEEERALLRAWRASGDPAQGEAWLRARLRSGGLSRGQLELAVVLGDAVAHRALAGGPRAELAVSRGPRVRTAPHRPEDALAWLASRIEFESASDWPATGVTHRLLVWAEELAPGAGTRGVLAVARLALERLGAAGPWLAAVDAAEACVACPCRAHAARVLEAEDALEAVAGSREPGALHALGCARDALQQVIEGETGGLQAGPVRSLAIGLAGGPQGAREPTIQRRAWQLVVEALRAALLPWTLGLEDPLAARHPAAPGEERFPLRPTPRDPGACQVMEHDTGYSDDPFDMPPADWVEVRRGGLAWSATFPDLLGLLARLRFHVIAGLARPLEASINGETVPAPYPPGDTATQLLALEEALASVAAWRRAWWEGRQGAPPA